MSVHKSIEGHFLCNDPHVRVEWPRDENLCNTLLIDGIITGLFTRCQPNANIFVRAGEECGSGGVIIDSR